MFLGLLGSALEGAGKGVADVAMEYVRQEGETNKSLLEQKARREDLIYQLRMKAQEEGVARTEKVGAIASQLDRNIESDLDQRYASPVLGETPLTPEQEAVQAEGLRQQRVERDRAKLQAQKDARNQLRAAVETGFESPDKLVGNDTKVALAEAKRQADAEAQRARVEIALAKLEGSSAGKPPVGYRQTAKGDLEAIPGGPADVKLQGKFNEDSAALSGAIASFDRLAEAANKVLTSPGLEGITGLRGKLPNIPGGDAANAQAALESLKSGVGFAVLQDMRNYSKTGGALGAISDRENILLQNNLASLDKAQSAEQLRESLKAIMTYADQAKDRAREAFNLRHGDKPSTGEKVPSLSTGAGGGAPKITSRDQLDQLPSGSLFTAPDGTVRRKP